MMMKKKAKATKRPVDKNDPLNPIQLLSVFSPLSETSLVPQKSTKYTIKGGGLSLNALSVRSAFGIIVTCLLFTAGKKSPITCSDFVPPRPDGTPGQRRKYEKIFQTNFGQGYVIASFLLNGVGPVDGEIDISLNHSSCKRRVIFADQFVNIDTRSPIDKTSTNSSTSKSQNDIESGPISTSTDNQLIYGVIGIGGNSDLFIGPETYFPVQGAGTAIDPFDTTLRTFYKLTSNTGNFNLRASSTGGNFSWGAAVFSLQAANLGK